MLTTLLVASASLPLLVSAQTAASLAYTPMRTACPEGFTLIRQTGMPGNQTLSTDEINYINGRKTNVLPGAFKAYLTNLQNANAPIPSYVADILNGNATNSSTPGAQADYPNIGIACSGGGWRASIFGAGILNVLDGRNTTSAAFGTGGLLQATLHLSGLSGGANLVGSLAQADFPTIQQLAIGTNATDATTAWGGWHAEISQTDPYTNSTTANEAYMMELIEEIRGKYEAGFAVAFNDFSSRDNGRHFINGTSYANYFDNTLPHGAGYLWSGVANLSTFQSYEQPFPIIVATLLSPNGNFSTLIPGGTFIIPQSNPILEFNVFEFGSYDPTLAAFTPMMYLGTTNETMCVTALDQTGTVIGASGQWNTVYNTSMSTYEASYVYPITQAMNETLPQTNVILDAAVFPNAFQGPSMQGQFIDANETLIYASDGASDGEAVPLQPLLVKARGLDTIIVADSNQDYADSYYSAGGSLVNVQSRIQSLFPTAYNFPPVPTNTTEFTAQNLSTRPTFFGCAASDASTPFIIYLANGGPPRDGAPALLNQQPGYVPGEELQMMLDQTYVIGTQGYPVNGTLSDPEWPACLACAVVDRARNRSGIERSGVCETCMDRYCWNGSTVGLETTNVSGGVKVSMGMGMGMWVMVGLVMALASLL